MELKLEFFGSLCETNEFSINGIDAHYWDFGNKSDHAPEDAEDYACGDMTFETDPLRAQEAMSKFGISEEEFYLIGKKLEEGLSFGSCGWCV